MAALAWVGASSGLGIFGAYVRALATSRKVVCQSPVLDDSAPLVSLRQQLQVHSRR